MNHTISIENKITNKIDFEEVIEDFAQSSHGRLNFESYTIILK